MLPKNLSMSNKKIRKNSNDFRGFGERVVSTISKKELLRIQSYLSVLNKGLLWCDNCDCYHRKNATSSDSENCSLD